MHRSKSLDKYHSLIRGLDNNNRKIQKPKYPTQDVNGISMITNSYYQSTLPTSTEHSQDKSSLISFRRGASLLDSFRAYDSGILPTEQSMSVIAQHVVTDRDPQISQRESLAKILASQRVQTKYFQIRPDGILGFAQKPMENPRITLDLLLKGMKLKRKRRTQSVPRERLPALHPNKIATLGPVMNQISFDHPKEDPSQRVVTEPVEAGNYFSQLKNERSPKNLKPLTHGIILPKLKIGKSNSELSERNYCKFKPSILDLMTDGNCQQTDRIFHLDKSISKIRVSNYQENYTNTQDGARLKNRKDENLLRSLEPRLARRRADLLTYINGINIDGRLDEEKMKVFIPQEMDDEDGRDAEDRAADALILTLAKYPFHRILLRLNRQVTLEFICEEKKRKVDVNLKAQRKKFSRVREKLREVLIELRRLKLTMGEVLLLIWFS